MNFKDISEYSLVELEVLDDLHKRISGVVVEKNESINHSYDEDLIMAVKSNNFPQFEFYIKAIKLGMNKSAMITYGMSPWADTVVKQNESTVQPDEIFKRFNQWVELLARYEQLDRSDPIIESYVDEIFVSLKVLDSDADTEPFDTRQQVAISNYLFLIQEMNKDAEYELAASIDREINYTRKRITTDSKNAVMKKISRILALSKKQGLKHYKMFVDVLKKEVLKKALWEGVEKAGELYDVIKLLN